MATKRKTSRQRRRHPEPGAKREWIDTSVALPERENALLERLATELSGGIIIDALERALLEYLHRAAAAGSTRGMSTRLDLAVRRRLTSNTRFNLKTAPIELPMPHADSAVEDDLLNLQTYLWVLVYAFDTKPDRVKTQGHYFLSDGTYLALLRSLVQFPAQDEARSLADDSVQPTRVEQPAKAVVRKDARLLRLRLPAATHAAAAERMEFDGVRSFSELVRRALREKAAHVGLDAEEGPTRPTFTHYPNPQLVEVQPNLEEPAQALTEALFQVAGKLAGRREPLSTDAARELALSVNTIVLALRRA